MKTTAEQRAEWRHADRHAPNSPMIALLDDLAEAEARAERAEKALTVARAWVTARVALREYDHRWDGVLPNEWDADVSMKLAGRVHFEANVFEDALAGTAPERATPGGEA